MKRALICSILMAAAACVMAAPTLTTDPYAPGPGQPTSCSLDASGVKLPCALVPSGAGGGSVTPTVDLAGLKSPGVYTVVLTLSNSNPATCTGGPVAWICDNGGGVVAFPAVTLTLRNGVIPTITPIHVTP